MPKPMLVVPCCCRCAVIVCRRHGGRTLDMVAMVVVVGRLVSTNPGNQIDL